MENIYNNYEFDLNHFMDNICDSLTNKKIKFEKLNDYELLLKTKDVDKVKKCILSLGYMTEDNFKHFIQISSIGEKTYIRQKVV